MTRSRPITATILAITAVSLLSAPISSVAQDPATYRSIRLAQSRSGTEPRPAVGPDGRMWIVTNNASGIAVYGSADGGQTWAATPGVPSLQNIATIDVDIVVTRTGRLIITLLSGAALQMPVWFSDNDGASWTRAIGPEIADQDRQFLAVGHDDPITGLPRVYLAYHNLFSGLGHHNMFVSTSIDAGATFGPPVPVTLPGTQEFLDMQCGDGGWPNGLMIDPVTGRLFTYWTTRTSAIGGCGAEPTQVNIIAGTRAWVASSPDASPGSWTSSIAVDRSSTGQIISTQFISGAIDAAGTFYVLYAETPGRYPNYVGAALKYTWAASGSDDWADPVTIVAPGGAGNITPHLVAGAPGVIGAAYFAGVERPGTTPAWHLDIARVANATSATPSITRQRASEEIAYTGEASLLMGACRGNGPTAGIEAGLLCSRMTDVWGATLNHDCRILVSWPTQGKGTWATTQTGGPTYC